MTAEWLERGKIEQQEREAMEVCDTRTKARAMRPAQYMTSGASSSSRPAVGVVRGAASVAPTSNQAVVVRETILEEVPFDDLAGGRASKLWSHRPVAKAG